METEALLDTALLRRLAGRLIPADTGLNAPAADDAAIFADIEAELRPNIPAMRALADTLATLGADDVAQAPLDDLLARIATAQPAAFPLFAMAVIQGYYRDDRVLRSLDMEARPPFPKGYEIDEGDLSLLDPVRARGPIWRQVG